jgi:hypothetical protein
MAGLSVFRQVSLATLGAVVLTFTAIGEAYAAAIGSAFSGLYSVSDLGAAPGVPTNYGGLTLKSGDPGTLLLGGSANNLGGSIFSIGVSRNSSSQITGFTGSAALFSTAPNIDGGLAYTPDGSVLFYAAYPNNTIGQIKTGSNSPDRIIDLNNLGVFSSVGALGFVPSGFAGAGQLKVLSYNGNNIYSFNVTPDGTGTFDFTPIGTPVGISGGPEGIVYVKAGNPGFANDSVLISEYGSNRVSAYDIDGNGDPIVGTRRDFVTGLSGALGATIDPVTGDFLFSTFGGSNNVLAVRGFNNPNAQTVPTPALLPGLLGLAMSALRKRKGETEPEAVKA